MEDKQSKPTEGAFLKSLIKVHHPDWTPAQIEAEYLRRLSAKESDDSDNGCEACSG